MEKIDVNVYGDSYPLRVERREVTEKAARDVDGVMRLFAEKAPTFELCKAGGSCGNFVCREKDRT